MLAYKASADLGSQSYMNSSISRGIEKVLTLAVGYGPAIASTFPFWCTWCTCAAQYASLPKPFRFYRKVGRRWFRPDRPSPVTASALGGACVGSNEGGCEGGPRGWGGPRQGTKHRGVMNACRCETFCEHSGPPRVTQASTPTGLAQLPAGRPALKPHKASIPDSGDWFDVWWTSRG